MSDVLELAGVACLVVFAGLLWWPATLLVVGGYLLLAGYAMGRSK